MKSALKKQFSFIQLSKKIFGIALLLGISAIKTNAQISLTATTGTTTGSYTTISDAFAKINDGTHKGVIVINVTANTTEPTTVTPLYGSGTASASSSSYTSVLIKPSGGSYTINSASTPSANRAVVELAGADSVTIDGDPTSSGTRSLTIAVATSTNVTAALRISSNSTAGSDGAVGVTVKNCTFLGSRPTFSTTTASYGISLSNYSTTSLTGGAYANNRITIQNNVIRRAHSAIYGTGSSSTYPNTNYKILNNLIGSTTASDIIGQYGIYFTYTGVTTGTNNALIEGNDIQVGDYATGYSTTVYGIYLSSYNYGMVIRKNNIHDISQSNSSGIYGAHGIYIASTLNNDIRIENNFIRDITANSYSATRTSTAQNHGIFISTIGTGLKMNHNTIYLNKANVTTYSSGSLASTAASSCITFSSASYSASQFMNNLLINNQGATSSNAYCIVTSGTANFPSTTNNNSYYTPSGGKIGYYSATDRTTLSDWQTATGLDAASVNENPSFTSSSDLHIPAGTYTLCESGGAATSVTGVSDDIDNQTRPGTTTYGFGTSPDIGADEFNGRVVYSCTTPSPGTTIKSPTTICFGSTLNLSLTTATTGTGVKYQWQSASSTSGPWTDISGQTAATAVVTPTAYEYYRCKVKCLAGPDSTYSTATQVAYTNSVTSTTGGSVCSTGTVNLAATTSGSGTLTWYAAATGGSSLGTGTTFTTPSISTTTDFFVANEAISTGTITNGTGTTAFSGIGNSPFSQSWESNRSQYLILASELSTLGLVAGNITGLSIPVSTKSSSMAFAGYTIKLGHTTATTMTASTYLSPTFTTVYGPTSYSSTSGANNFSFSSSFNWDGTSNILIDICFDNDPTGSGILYTSNDAVTTTTKPYMAVVGMYNDNATLCGATTGGTYVNTTSLPNFTFSGNVGCFSPRVPVTATVNTLPTAPTVTSPVNYCIGAPSPSALSATGTSLKWYTVPSGGTASSAAPTPSTATVGTVNYYVTQTNSTTLCESPRALIAVVTNALPAAPTVATPINFCIGSTASALTATGSGLLWYSAATGGTGSTTAPTPSTAAVGTTNYYVSQTDALTCESNRATIEVIVNSILPAPTVSSPVNICQGSTASALSATGTGLLWYTVSSGGIGSATAPTPSSASTGTTNYYVSQSASGACEGPRALIAAQVNPLPVAPTVSSPVTYCQNIPATALTASGTSLLWYTVSGGGTGSTTAPTPSTTASGTTPYYVSQTNSFSCEGPRALLNVIVNPAPALATISTPVVYCQNYTASALSAAGTSLKWYTVATGGTGSTTAPTPSTATATTLNYYVTQSNTTTLCESQRANIVVTINPTPTAPTVSTPIAYCQNATSAAALTATGTSLRWYSVATGGSGSTTAPTPSTATVGAFNNYVSQTNTFNCESPRANLIVNINPLPLAPTVISPLNLCIGSTASPLTASGTSLLWYNTAASGIGSSAAPTPNTTSVGTSDYFVSQTNTFTCEGPRSKLTVQVKPLPILNISSLATSGFLFCRYQSISLKANAPTATSYQWSFNSTIKAGDTSSIIIADTSGYFKVVVADVYGCKNKDSVWAQRDTSVLPTLSPTSVQICENSEINLTTNPSFSTWSFRWMLSGSPLLPLPTGSIAAVSLPGTYTVITTNSYGCIDTTNSAMVSNYAKPSKPTVINAKPLLSVPAAYTYYQWYKNNATIVGANSNNYNTTTDGFYFVEVTDGNGCVTQSDTVQIKFTTGISNTANLSHSIKIYPNPTRNMVFIDAPIKVNVKVTDIVGKMVMNAKETKEINLEQFAEGTYLIIISDTENNILTIEKINKM